MEARPTMAAQAQASSGSPGHLERLRHAELEPLRRYFAPGARVLELGGGNGYQASVLHAWGCRVTSIDIAPAVSGPSFHPVSPYDGAVIPFPARSFDVVFSSNVLEHVPLPRLLGLGGEIRRVLTDSGRAVHVLPSPAWRLWSWLTRYGALVERAAGWREAAPLAGGTATPPGRGRGGRIARALVPPPHGEYPTAVSELYYFSRRRWSRVFREAGFEVLAATRAGVFYTDHTLCRSLSISARRRLSHVLGSACHVYVLRPDGARR